MVDPLIRQPIAMAAVKAPLDDSEVVDGAAGASLLSRLTRFVAEAFMIEGAAFDDCT
jgi:hypothetical protein